MTNDDSSGWLVVLRFPFLAQQVDDAVLPFHVQLEIYVVHIEIDVVQIEIDVQMEVQ